MLINQILSVFFPAIISLKMYEKMNEKVEPLKAIQKYGQAVLIINIIMYFILIYLVKQVEFVFTNSFTLKYLVLASIIAVIYSIIAKCVSSNIKCEVEVEKSDVKKS